MRRLPHVQASAQWLPYASRMRLVPLHIGRPARPSPGIVTFRATCSASQQGLDDRVGTGLP
jgi:hypothetical protein